MIEFLETIRAAATHTPIWVYIVFLYLLWIGIKSTSTQVIDFKKLFIAPVVILILGSFDLKRLNFENIEIISLLSLAISLIFGLVIGYWRISKASAKIDKLNTSVELPGSWDVLIVLILIFSAKYFLYYKLATQPNLANNNILPTIFVFSFSFGFFVGRLSGIIREFLTNRA